MLAYRFDRRQMLIVEDSATVPFVAIMGLHIQGLKEVIEMHAEERVRLVKPAVEYGEAYAEMVREFLQTEEAWFNNFPLALEDFPTFVAGLPRVMLTIEGDNAASVRVIEKNGGWLDYQRRLPETGELLSCYWIDL